MEGILFKDITKIYDGGVKAVSNFNLQVSDSDFLVLVGPSGCGKSTLLRMVAGLEDITAGELYFGNKLMNKIHPKDRDIAMVFQNYALYPHKTVYDNMAFGLKLKRMPAMMIEERVLEAAQRYGLTIRAVLLTHGHFDHVGGVRGVAEAALKKGFVEVVVGVAGNEPDPDFGAAVVEAGAEIGSPRAENVGERPVLTGGGLGNFGVIDPGVA